MAFLVDTNVASAKVSPTNEDEIYRRDLAHLIPNEMCINPVKCVTSGALKCLELFKQRGGRISYNLYLDAAHNGHLHILMWLEENGAYRDRNAVAAAAAGGHLHIVKWMVANDFPKLEEVCCEAVEYGHAHVLEYALEERFPVIAEVYITAAEKGYIDCLRLLLERGGLDARELDLCAHATACDDIQCVQWLMERGMPKTAQAVDWARIDGKHQHVQWLLEHGFPDSETPFECVS